MNKQRRDKRGKLNRGNKRLYGRLAVVCVEIFVLVVITGIGLLFFLDAKKEQESKEIQQAAVVEELLIDAEKTAQGLDGGLEDEMAETESVEDTSRYGKELADVEYCMQNRIYTKEAASEEEIVLAFAGDVSFAEGYAIMAALAQRGDRIEECFDSALFREMHDADIFMINNEFPYTDRGTPLAEKTFTFRAKPDSVKYLNDMGVDIVSVANNHVYDYGEVSLLDTLSTLEGAKMPYVGAGRDIEEAVKPVYFVINDIKIAYISATQIEQGDFPDTVGAGENSAGVFRCWNEERIYDVVREAKEQSDFVITYIHWGTELSETLHWAQSDQAVKLADAGADLIVGDHPHCLQEITYIGDTPVVYSMGNFWFNSKTQDTGLLKVVLDENGLNSMQFVPAIQSGCRTSIAPAGEKERILAYLRTLSPNVHIDADGYIQK